MTIINHLTGPEYSEKVAENSVAIMKSWGKYTDAEAKAVDKFLEAFKPEDFPPGDSVLFTQSPKGSIGVSVCAYMSAYLVLYVHIFVYFGIKFLWLTFSNKRHIRVCLGVKKRQRSNIIFEATLS